MTRKKSEPKSRPKIEEVLNRGKHYSWSFRCPGCGCSHQMFTVAPHPGGPQWKFNGDVNKPTFEPSLRVQWNHGDKSFNCHSYIRDGFIQFLGDCTHKLAGKTVEMENI